MTLQQLQLGQQDGNVFKLFKKEMDLDMQQEIIELKRRVSDFESFKLVCESEHKEHHQYRRSTDDKLEGTNAVLTKILSILEKFEQALPTVKRSQDAYTAIDTIKSAGLWIGAVCGALVAIYTLVNSFI